MSTLLSIVDQERCRNQVLGGLTHAGIRAALASSRLVSRPQGIDIAFCIDVTSSMEPFIDTTRRIVSGFHDALGHRMNLRGLSAGQVRARVIAFRDYFHDKEPMRETSFLRLPQEEWALKSIVDGLVPDGGGDAPESSLEALSLALDSAWLSGGPDSVHIVVLLTDAPAHRLDKSKEGTMVSRYPDGMPGSLAELESKWNRFCAESNAGVQRLVIFAPDTYPWHEIGGGWANVLHLISSAGEGLRMVPEDLIVESIALGLS